MVPVTAARGYSRAATAVVLATVALDSVAKGMILPILPTLLGSIGLHDPALVATALGTIVATFSVAQFVMAPVQGALSDRFGRRPVMLLSNFALGLDCMLLALAPSLSWILVARLLSGAAAGSIAAANAYIVDVTPPARRGAAFGWIGAAMGVGFVLGPAVGGAIGQLDVRLPFWLAGCLSLANGAVAYWLLPESLPADRRAALTLRHLNPLTGVTAILANHARMRLAFVAVFLFAMASYGFSSFIVIFATYRFGWRSAELGLTMMVFGIATVVVQVGLVGKAIGRLGYRSAIGGFFALQALGLVAMGFSATPILFLVLIAVLAASAIGESAWSALLTHAVDEHEQGRLAGAVGAVNGIAAILSPMVLAAAFAHAPGGARDGVGYPMILAGVFVLIGLGPAIVAARRIATPAAGRAAPRDRR